MFFTDYGAMMIIGGVFLIIGIVVLILGSREEKDYFRNISNRTDVRQYLEYKPDSIQSWGLKVGGVIALVIGLVLLVMGLIFWLWG